MTMGPLLTVSLGGVYNVSTGDGKLHSMRLPGTLDENNIGHRDTPGPDTDRMKSADSEDLRDPLDRLLDEEGLLFSGEAAPVKEDERIRTRLTRKYTYEGAARLSRMISVKERPGKRYFIEAERARVLSLLIDGKEVPHFRPASLNTPHIFEVTGLLHGNHMLTVISDNSYPGLPREIIKKSNTASDDTQTNWNGIVGYFRLREENNAFVEALHVRVKEGKLTVRAELSAKEACEVRLKIASDALTRDYEKKVRLPAGKESFVIGNLPCREDLKKWDEEEGKLYKFSLFLDGVEKTVSFGVRDIGTDTEGRLTLNGRRIFLRGDMVSGTYPETSYAPMDENAWKKILLRYRSYGVNVLLFHSHCPPEAAFSAADGLGMLLMPSLSLYQGERALSNEKGQEFYKNELMELLYAFGNHPSFGMLSLGEDLDPQDEGRSFLEELLFTAKSTAPDKLFSASFAPGGDHSDFGDFILYGGGNLPKNPKKPVFSVGNGAYSILPDFREIDLFSAYLEPDNLIEFRENAEKEGFLTNWTSYISSGGETAILLHKETVEKTLRTPAFSGMFLSGLQDQPGRGGYYYGMMNSHLQPKAFPFAAPERFSAFYAPVSVLADFPGPVYENEKTFVPEILLVNYGKETLKGEVLVTLLTEENKVERRLSVDACPPGTVLSLGKLAFPLVISEEDGKKAEKFSLRLKFGKYVNEYPVWVYDTGIPICPADVLEADMLSQNVWDTLSMGGTVFLTPPAAAEYLPGSVEASYEPSSKNSLRAPGHYGITGRSIDRSHPLFRDFPTEEYADLRWRNMCSGRAVILPRRMKTILSALPDVTDIRPLGELFEFRCGGGNVLFSSMGLKEKMQYPEVRALLSDIYDYLDSYEFSPSQELRPEELKTMLLQ